MGKKNMIVTIATVINVYSRIKTFRNSMAPLFPFSALILIDSGITTDAFMFSMNDPRIMSEL
jgi:hypothetical protein